MAVIKIPGIGQTHEQAWRGKALVTISQSGVEQLIICRWYHADELQVVRQLLFIKKTITLADRSQMKAVELTGRMAINLYRHQLLVAGIVAKQGLAKGNEQRHFTPPCVIKDVRAMTAHMNKSRRWHAFDPLITSFPPKEKMPKTMNWDVWLNTAQYHDYNKDYHEGQWRCWYDFGMGALGDWGAHIMDTAHRFLDLGLPYEINPVFLEGHNSFFFPFSFLE